MTILQTRALRLPTAIALTALVAAASAQNANPRFGKWKLKSDQPPPALNIMTYEPYGEGGMRVTVEATSWMYSCTTSSPARLPVFVTLAITCTCPVGRIVRALRRRSRISNVV